ncbi:MFS transporter [Paraburkholderia guartelaensis]|uniref:MFS transporter n=2 Tax=Paraburkholderia guartelaensis TaxID=2546446 RepID=A0A4R5L4E1_9BURK|nr:MFS transporter [Paraburkholderia guartelaensis]
MAVGGEWGGAVLIATEHAPQKWRTLLASAPQYGSPVGLILATVAFKLVNALPKSDFMSWGWRIPFLFSGVLVLVAYLIRRGVGESPELEIRKAAGSISDIAPFHRVLQSYKRALVLGICFCMLGISGFYFITTLMMSFATTYLHVEKGDMLNVITWVGVVELISFPIGSYLANKFGERKFLLVVTAGAFAWSFPMVHLITSGSIPLIAIGILCTTGLIGGYYAVLSSYLPRAFPVEVRYTGISLSFQLCGAIFGGTTPLIGLWVASSFGVAFIPLGTMFAIISGVTFIATVALPVSPEESFVKVPDNFEDSAAVGVPR